LPAPKSFLATRPLNLGPRQARDVGERERSQPDPMAIDHQSLLGRGDGTLFLEERIDGLHEVPVDGNGDGVPTGEVAVKHQGEVRSDAVDSIAEHRPITRVTRGEPIELRPHHQRAGRELPQLGDPGNAVKVGRLQLVGHPAVPDRNFVEVPRQPGQRTGLVRFGAAVPRQAP
jgi:hypothetical protein